MSRQPKTNPKNDPDVIRISFLLDLKSHTELDSLRTMTGHGERPRELLRLAKLGLMREEDDKRILDTVRAQHSAQPLIITSAIPRTAPSDETSARQAPEEIEAKSTAQVESYEPQAMPDEPEVSDTSEFTAPPSSANSAAEDGDDDRASPDTASAFLA